MPRVGATIGRKEAVAHRAQHLVWVPKDGGWTRRAYGPRTPTAAATISANRWNSP